MLQKVHLREKSRLFTVGISKELTELVPALSCGAKQLVTSIIGQILSRITEGQPPGFAPHLLNQRRPGRATAKKMLEIWPDKSAVRIESRNRIVRMNLKVREYPAVELNKDAMGESANRVIGL